MDEKSKNEIYEFIKTNETSGVTSLRILYNCDVREIDKCLDYLIDNGLIYSRYLRLINETRYYPNNLKERWKSFLEKKTNERKSKK